MIEFRMPRKSRIDAAGALHHIIARGIEGLPIFQNDADRVDFLRRLAELALETETHCLAWSLMANHSSGGWATVKTMRRLKLFQKSDERILGDSEFVEQVLSYASEQMERKYRLQEQGFDLAKVAAYVCQLTGITEPELWAAGKERRRVRARSLFCYWASRDLGTSQAELSRKLKISPAAVTFSVMRGERIAAEAGFKLP